jgi:hypothetical protein
MTEEKSDTSGDLARVGRHPVIIRVGKPQRNYEVISSATWDGIRHCALLLSLTHAK